MVLIRKLSLGLTLCLTTLHVAAQHNIGTGKAKELYLKNCASCHGDDLAGKGIGGSLSDDNWRFGGTDASISDVIERGRSSAGMPAFGNVFNRDQIRSLTILIREHQALVKSNVNDDQTSLNGKVFTTRKHKFTAELYGQGSDTLWGMAFLPDGSMLATQQDGKLWQFRNGERRGPIKNTPEVLFEWQGGLLDVSVHPEYVDNGWVYLSYSEASEAGSMTRVVRGKIHKGVWRDQETIFAVPSDYHLSAGHHYGGRIVLDDAYIYISVGDRGDRNSAQDLRTPNGKIHRLFDDGKLPPDNPFLDKENAYPSIWTLGHRNPQGLDLHQATDQIWSSEHGPRGGDEVNLIVSGKNYGWPLRTTGMNYDGTPITSKKGGLEFVMPKQSWTPSISPGGIKFYNAGVFPNWGNSLFVGGMGAQELHRLEVVDDQIHYDELIFRGYGRVRDIESGPDGYLYLLVNTREPSSSSIFRLVPAE